MYGFGVQVYVFLLSSFFFSLKHIIFPTRPIFKRDACATSGSGTISLQRHPLHKCHLQASHFRFHLKTCDRDRQSGCVGRKRKENNTPNTPRGGTNVAAVVTPLVRQRCKEL
uniref:Uncharacterized protein n=1 Tax=Anopheles culicifacies TaxID=139723 RepID=A0A182MC71_9DIPT